MGVGAVWVTKSHHGLFLIPYGPALVHDNGECFLHNLLSCITECATTGRSMACLFVSNILVLEGTLGLQKAKWLRKGCDLLMKNPYGTRAHHIPLHVHILYIVIHMS